MSGINLFRSATLKIERADRHISDLGAAFKAFSQTHDYEIVIHGNVKNGPLFFEVVHNGEVPPELGLIVGDAIHNTRAALDHAMWQLIALDGGTRDRFLQFPTRDNRINFEAACRGIKTPEQSTIDFLTRLEVYPGGGGELLYWLAQLDNAEKHTVVVPVLNAASVESIEFIDLATSKHWRSENVVLIPDTNGRSFIQCAEGVGINCNHKFKPTLGIFFGDVAGVPNQPILPTLLHFRDAVAETLQGFRRLIADRDPFLSASQRAQIIG